MPAVDVLTLDRPEQLKALGHPLRLRVLQVLGERDEELTNREIAERVGVDPGHLHFHVRMLLAEGLIAPGDAGSGREKPYRAVAGTIRVAPELLGTGAANDARQAMLDEVQRAWSRFAPAARFRSAQITVRMDPERIPDVWKAFADWVRALEDPAQEPIVITLFAHPRASDDGESG